MCVIPFLFHFFFFTSLRIYANERERVRPAETREFSASRCRSSLYIFEQLVSRSFSTVRLTLTRSVTPSLGTLQSQLSAIRMRVITRHSWLLRSTSTPAKFPRSNANARGSAHIRVHRAHTCTHIDIYIHTRIHARARTHREELLSRE